MKMKTPNHVVVSLNRAQDSDVVAGLYKRLSEIKIICGFIVLTGIVINDIEMQPVAVQCTYDEVEEWFIFHNVYGYDIKVADDSTITFTETIVGTKLYKHNCVITTSNDDVFNCKIITDSNSPIDEYASLALQNVINVSGLSSDTIYYVFALADYALVARDSNDDSIAFIGIDDAKSITDTVTPL